MITMKMVTLRSLLPVLKIRTSRSDLESFLPEIAEISILAIRKIGVRKGVLHLVKDFKIDIHNEYGNLPPGFFKLDTIKTCGVGACGCDNFVTSCSCENDLNCTCGFNYCKRGYADYWVENCFIRSSYPSGSVTIDYHEIPHDREGFPMIPEDYSDAVMRYIADTFKEGELAARKIQPHEYQIFNEKWKEQAIIARSDLNGMSKQEAIITGQMSMQPMRFYFNGIPGYGIYGSF